MRKIYLLLFVSILMSVSGMAATWYSSTAGAVTNLANWNSLPGGGGLTPANFTTAGDVWIINRNMTIAAGGGGTWTVGNTTVVAPSLYTGSVTITTGGRIVQTSGTRTLNLYCNLVLTGSGYIDCNGGTGMNINLYGNFICNGTGGINDVFGSTENYFYFANTNSSYADPQIMDLTGATQTFGGTGFWDWTYWNINANVSVQMNSNFNDEGFAFALLGAGSTLNCQANVLSGTGGLTMVTGSYLYCGAATGINGDITVTGFSTLPNTAYYGFNGIVQQVTGSMMPTALAAGGGMIVNNTSGADPAVTLSASTSFAVGSTLTMTSGILGIGAGNTLTLSNNPTFTSTLCLSGSATSNLMLSGAATTNTIFFDQTIQGTTNKIATLTLNGATTALAIGTGGSTNADNLYVGTNLAFSGTNDKVIINNNTLTTVGVTGMSPTNFFVGGVTSSLVLSNNVATAQSIFFGTTPTLNNLTINCGTGTAPTPTTAAIITLGNALTINGGGQLNLDYGQFTLTGALTMGNLATINRSVGSLSGTPVFGTNVNVNYCDSNWYSAATVITGTEIPASATVLNNLSFNKGIIAGESVALGSSAAVNGALNMNAGTNAYTLNGGAGGFNFTLKNSNGWIQPASITFNGGNGTVLFAYAGSQPLTITSPGVANFNNLTISPSTIVTATTSNFNVLGNWTNNSSTAAFSSTGTVTFNGTTQTIGGAFGTTFGNITLNPVTSVTLAQPITVNSTLLHNTGSLNPGANTVTALGNYSMTGTSTLATNTGGVIFGAAGIQNLSIAPTATANFNNFTINSGATINSGTDNFNVSGNWNNFSGTTAFNNSGTVTCNGNVQTIGGGFATTFNNLTINPATSVNLGQNITTNGNLLISSGTLNDAGLNINVAGNFINNATLSTTGIVDFIGSGVQSVGGSTATVFGNLTINNTSTGTPPVNGVTLGNNIGVSGLLILLNGVINTGTYSVTLNSSGSVLRVPSENNNYIYGMFVKNIPAGTASISYEIGDAVDYAPVQLLFNAPSTGSNSLGAKSTYAIASEPNFGTSHVTPFSSINKYWTLTTSGIAGVASITPVFTYTLGDITGGSDQNFYCALDLGGTGTWDSLNASFNATEPPYSASVTAVAIASVSGNYIFGLKAPPALTAAVGATVDNPYTVTFVNDGVWGGIINDIKVNISGTPSDLGAPPTGSLVPGSYTLTVVASPGISTITFNPAITAALQTAGLYTITVYCPLASGYGTNGVYQLVGPGIARSLYMQTQPGNATYNGCVLAPVPVVGFKDQYANATGSFSAAITPTVTATATGGTWTIGGTTVLTPSGSPSVCAFSALTAYNLSALAGNTISFTAATGAGLPLTPVVSGTFNIPAPSVSITGSSCGSPVLTATGSVFSGALFAWTTTAGGGLSSGGGVNVFSVTATPTVISNYSVTTNYNIAGCVSPPATFTVYPLPAVAISSVTAGGCTYSLTSACTNCAGFSLTTYAWTPTVTLAAPFNIYSVIATPSGGGVYSLTVGATDGCNSTTTITLPSLTPNPITGPASEAIGGLVTLTETTVGGTWSTTYGSLVTLTPVGLTCGVTGVAGGNAIITYTGSCGGFVTYTVNVHNAYVEHFYTTEAPLPIGWSTTLLNGTYGLSIVASGTFPTLNAEDAPTANYGMIFYNSFNAPTGDSAEIVTFPFDLSAIGTNTDYVTFWVNRDNGYAGTPDEGVRVYIGTTNAIATATPLCFVDRNSSGTAYGYPGVAFAGVSSPGVANLWYQYTVAIPASFNGTANYLFFDFPSQFGNNIYLDEVGWTIYNNPRIVPNVSSVNVGAVCPGAISAAGNFTVSAASLALPAGNITATGPAGVLLSTTGIAGSYASSVTLPFVAGTPTAVGGSLANTKLWVEYSPTITATAGAFSVNVTLSGGGATPAIVGLTGTINPLPAAVVGPTSICMGSTATYSDATTPGTWSSGTPGVATIGAGTGALTTVATGNTVITFSATATGCTAASTVTVTTGAAAIGGPTSICNGSTTVLTDASGAGTWTSSAPGVASISGSGTLSAVGVGITVVTFSVTGTSCTATSTVTVNTQPVAIGGTFTICPGASTSLSDGTGGGTWSSSAAGVATISAGGTVTGIGSGTTSIAYTLGSCPATQTVLVSPSPAAIGGPTSLCNGSTTVLTDASGAGTWSSSASGVASIAGSGTLTAVGIGNTVVTFSLTSTGCTATSTVTVNTQPVAISGTFTLCAGTNTLLTDGTGGGFWSSTNPAVASMDIVTLGQVDANSSGTTLVAYSVGSCSVSQTITVNPSPGAIVGSLVICNGSVETLTDPAGAGTWSSSSTGVASITAAGGVLTASSNGSAVISFTATATGCTTTTTVTVNSSPGPITGTFTVCPGTNTTLSNIISSGTWSSSNPAVATIDPVFGSLTGVGSGTTTIGYAIGTCSVSQTITVKSAPAAIVGTTTFCSGTGTTLSDITSPGLWSSSNPGVASIGAGSGALTTSSSGSAVITFSATATGCTTTTTVTVNPSPGGAITGTFSICPGTINTLSDITAGGTWSSSNSAVATIDPTFGAITIVAPGSTLIGYSIGSCSVTQTEVVYSAPASIVGTTTLCDGLGTTLTDGTGPGTWSSSNPGVATIGAGTGAVTTSTAGSTVITYTVTGTGCTTNTTLTVNPSPGGPITGTYSICPGTINTLSDITAGGTWSSSNSAVATIDPTFGAITIVAPGSTLIGYSIGSCSVTQTEVVYSAPASIGGTTTLCDGVGTTLTDGTGPGTWSSSNPGVASIGAGTGIVTTSTAGSTVITYTVTGTGCTTNTTLTVNPSPGGPITGTYSVCVGTISTLSDITGGGTWSSSSAGVATIDPTFGGVDAISPGTTSIAYAIGSCSVTQTVTVNPNPAVISGITTLCNDSTTTLTDISSPGTWSSASPGVATIGSSTGILSTVSAGSAIISYALSTGCYTTTSVTVNTTPVSITGTFTLCQGDNTSLADLTGSGTWSSSSIGVATIDPTSGVVSAISAGTTTISYILGVCPAVVSFLVNPLPALIGGTTTICNANTTTLTDGTSPGTWSSGTPTVATIDPSLGIVSAVAAGTSNISYTLPTGCYVTTPFNVNPLPGAITGTLNVCYGNSTSLSDTSTGGAWSVGTSSVATIDPTFGVLSGIDSGVTTSIFTYTATGCFVTAIDTVYQIPTPISGPIAVCESGSTITLSDAVASGAWTSSASGTASVVTTSGILTGIASGSVTVTYMLPTGCTTTTGITVNPLPLAITGSNSVCASGSTITLSDGSGTGTWSSSSTSTATIDPTLGVVTGLVAGLDIITYTLPVTGCAVAYSVTVNPLPATIGGTLNVCPGNTVTLTDGSTPGAWSTGTPTVATIGSSSGVLTGLSSGVTMTTYTLPTGCSISTIDTIYALPAAIAGTFTAVCAGGSTITLTDDSTGGAWSIAPGTTASITAGVVTGIAAGTASVVYTMPYTGCIATTNILVNPLPNAIGGTLNVCPGDSVALTETSTPGTWSISGGTASISTSGELHGIAAGVANTTYTLPTGCAITVVDTIYPLPATIGGPTFVCASGATITLTDASGGGTWTTTATSASIDPASGIVTGISAGSATISYVVTRTGCMITTTETVDPLPSAIFGTNGVCAGLTTTLHDTTGVGTWSITPDTIATIGTTGIVTAIMPGTVVATYVLSVTGCSVSDTVVVNPLPAPITGYDSVCKGSTITLSSVSGASPAIWLSSTGTVATIDSFTGLVTGVNAGVTTITYLFTATGCLDSTHITVNPLPLPITGSLKECQGKPSTLSEVTTGGVWVSYTPANATVDTAGRVTNIHNGYASIAYLLPTGCQIMVTDTIMSIPAAITGLNVVCLGSSVTLANDSLGGTWSSSVTAVATVSSTGVVTSVSAGVSIVTYALSDGCFATDSIFVAPNVIPTITVSSGPDDTVCAGTVVTFSVTGSSGGPFPLFEWSVYGFPTGVTGTTYSLIPTFGEVVTCTMISDVACGLHDTVTTIPITMFVEPNDTPSVSIVDFPSFPTDTVTFAGELVTFNASVVYGGSDPAYQWYDNGVAVPGATSSSFNKNINSPDTIYCVVTSNYRCRATSTDTSNVYTLYTSALTVNSITNIGNLSLFPDPNNGNFILNGKLNGAGINNVEIAITDMLGKVVYISSIIPVNGMINEPISLSNNIASGNYFMKITSGGETQVMQFSVTK